MSNSLKFYSGCPPKFCCRRNYEAKPITDREIRYCGFFSFIMTAGVLASGIAGKIILEKKYLNMKNNKLHVDKKITKNICEIM